jgi:hypothetical protein
MSYRERHPELHQEEDNLPRWKVLVALLTTAVIGAIFIAAAVSLNAARIADLRPSGFFPERWLGPRRPVGRVRQDVFGELRREPTLAERKERELGSYGWVDRDRGVVRIPIDRAMDLVEQGRRP